MKHLFLLLFMAVFAISANAADGTQSKSTVHLKSGEFATGVITARDDNHVEILSDDNIKYVYQMSDVDYITHDTKKKNYDTSKFRGFVDAGYSLGFGSPRNDYTLIETSFGYQFNYRYYLGLGLGVHIFDTKLDTYPMRQDAASDKHNDPDWKYPFVPLYLEGRYNLRPETKGTPFASLKIGATFINHSGFFASPSIGYHFNTSQFFSVNLSVGYALQTANYKLWCTGATPNYKLDESGNAYLSKTPAFHNAFLKIGVEF
jgi:opacity protein-like surface antigen